MTNTHDPLWPDDHLRSRVSHPWLNPRSPPQKGAGDGLSWNWARRQQSDQMRWCTRLQDNCHVSPWFYHTSTHQLTGLDLAFVCICHHRSACFQNLLHMWTSKCDRIGHQPQTHGCHWSDGGWDVRGGYGKMMADGNPDPKVATPCFLAAVLAHHFPSTPAPSEEKKKAASVAEAPPPSVPGSTPSELQGARRPKELAFLCRMNPSHPNLSSGELY